MTDKEKIEDLERRVKELEARPMMPQIIPMPYPIYIKPAPDPFYQPWPGYPYPFIGDLPNGYMVTSQ